MLPNFSPQILCLFTCLFIMGCGTILLVLTLLSSQETLRQFSFHWKQIGDNWILFQDRALLFKKTKQNHSHLKVNLCYMGVKLHSFKKSQHDNHSSYHCSFVLLLKIRIRTALIYTALDSCFVWEKNPENWKGHNLGHMWHKLIWIRWCHLWCLLFTIQFDFTENVFYLMNKYPQAHECTYSTSLPLQSKQPHHDKCSRSTNKYKNKTNKIQTSSN